MIPLLILCQYDQVPSALVGLSLFLVHSAVRHIHLATNDGFEQFVFGFRQLDTAVRQFSFLIFASNPTTFYACNPFFKLFDFPFRTAVLLVDVIGKFFNAEHITVVGHGYSLHSVLHCLVNQSTNACLTIKK